MSKPKWLRDKQAGAKCIERHHDYCNECIYFGPFVKWTRRKGNVITELHECDIHPKCFNTKFAICCDDFTRA